MTSLLLFYSCCFRPNWLRPIHPQLRREPREKLAPLVLSFLTLFNLQGARPSSGTVTIISGSVSFVKYFFKPFSDFFFPIFSDLQAPDSFTSSPSNSLVRIPDTSPFVNGFFQVFLSFLSEALFAWFFAQYPVFFPALLYYNTISYQALRWFTCGSGKWTAPAMTLSL